MIFLKIVSFVPIAVIAAFLGAILSLVLTLAAAVLLLQAFFEWIYYSIFPEMKPHRHVIRLSDFEQTEYYKRNSY